jgi:hypothetical protein
MFRVEQDWLKISLCHFLQTLLCYYLILKSKYSPQLIVPNILSLEMEGISEDTGEVEDNDYLLSSCLGFGQKGQFLAADFNMLWNFTHDPDYDEFFQWKGSGKWIWNFELGISESSIAVVLKLFQTTAHLALALVLSAPLNYPILIFKI